MTLHEAMREVLRTAPGRRLTPRELAEQVNRRGLYRMRDGRPVEVQQIHARATNYPQFFARDGDAIALRDDAAGDPTGSSPAGVPPLAPPPEPSGIPLGAPAHPWPWEGAVQHVFVEVLTSHGWTVTSTADTATKEHGVDVIAAKGARRLGAEVKGYPLRTYADPRRAGEQKRTTPTTQAGHWFSQAVLKALMLLDSHPGRESLVVLPDEHRYRDFAGRTRTGRALAGIHVVVVRRDGSIDSDTWAP